MKIIITEAQYNSLTEENMREFLYSFWDRQKKIGEEPSLHEIIYDIFDFNKETREDYDTIRPIWYEYNGGYSVLENKIRKEIDTKEFNLVEPEFNLRTKIKVVNLKKVESFLEIMVDVDPRGSIKFWGWNEDTDEQYEIDGTIEDAYLEAQSNYETGDLLGSIRAAVYDFFYELLEKYGVPIEVDVDLEEIQGDVNKINEADEKNSDWESVLSLEKYWKKKLERGENITYDEDELKYFGITTRQYEHYARFKFQDLVGGEEFFEKFIKTLMDKTFSTKDFGERLVGGYDFEWVITDMEYRDYDFFLYGKTLPGGTVSMIMTDGRNLTLQEALEDEDIGWEIQEEVNDVVQDCMNEIILPVTGYDVTIPLINISEE